MCKYKKINCSLTERINSIIEKYELNLSICSSKIGGILPSSTLNYQQAPQIYTKRPVSACITDIRSPKINILPSLSLIDIKCHDRSVNKCHTIPPICPGPNLKNYLSTKLQCPSLNGRLMLYENYQPLSSSNNYQINQSKTYCQCKKTCGLINNKCDKIIKPKLNTTIPICSWNNIYEPPFSSTILEREFTSRFIKVPYRNC